MRVRLERVSETAGERDGNPLRSRLTGPPLLPLVTRNTEPSPPHRPTRPAPKNPHVGGGNGGGSSLVAERWRTEASRTFQHYLDRAAPHTAGRWAGTLLSAAVYALWVYYAQGFYVVSYGLGICLLNLLIGFLSPMVDPEVEALNGAGPVLPTRGNDKFKPFSRRLPEFKFWLYAFSDALSCSCSLAHYSV